MHLPLKLALERMLKNLMRILNIGATLLLLHDFDYEKFPTAEEHPFKGSEILKEKGFDEEFRNAILSHADYSGVPRDTLSQNFICLR